jgi:DNA polymerase-3 subunit gamma/tau
MQTFLDGLTEHYRNLLVARSTNSAELIMESESVKQKYSEYISSFSEIEIINSLKLILQTEETFKYSSNQRTLIEALLIELIKFADTSEVSLLLEELRNLGSGNTPITPKAKNEQAKNESGSKSGTEKEIKVSYENVKKNDEPGESIHTNITARESGNVDLSSGDLNSHWLSIKDQIKTERKWVYSIIKDSVFEKDGNSNYLLRVDENTYELADGYKDYLSGKIAKYFGESVSISLVKDSDAVSEIPAEKNENTKINNPQDNYDKIHSILVREFNAKEIS